MAHVIIRVCTVWIYMGILAGLVLHTVGKVWESARVIDEAFGQAACWPGGSHRRHNLPFVSFVFWTWEEKKCPQTKPHNDPLLHWSRTEEPRSSVAVLRSDAGGSGSPPGASFLPPSLQHLPIPELLLLLLMPLAPVAPSHPRRRGAHFSFFFLLLLFFSFFFFFFSFFFFFFSSFFFFGGGGRGGGSWLDAHNKSSPQDFPPRAPIFRPARAGFESVNTGGSEASLAGFRFRCDSAPQTTWVLCACVCVCVREREGVCVCAFFFYGGEWRSGRRAAIWDACVDASCVQPFSSDWLTYWPPALCFFHLCERPCDFDRDIPPSKKKKKKKKKNKVSMEDQSVALSARAEFGSCCSQDSR